MVMILVKVSITMSKLKTITSLNSVSKTLQRLISTNVRFVMNRRESYRLDMDNGNNNDSDDDGDMDEDNDSIAASEPQ